MWNQKNIKFPVGNLDNHWFFFKKIIAYMHIQLNKKIHKTYISVSFFMNSLLFSKGPSKWNFPGALIRRRAFTQNRTLTQQFSISLDRSFKLWFSPFLRKPSFNFLLILHLVMNWTIITGDNPSFPPPHPPPPTPRHTHTSSLSVFSQLSLKWDLTSTLLCFYFYLTFPNKKIIPTSFLRSVAGVGCNHCSIY